MRISKRWPHSHNNCKQQCDSVLFIWPSKPCSGSLPLKGNHKPRLCLVPDTPSPLRCPSPSQEMEGISEKEEGSVWLGMFLWKYLLTKIMQITEGERKNEPFLGVGGKLCVPCEKGWQCQTAGPRKVKASTAQTAKGKRNKRQQFSKTKCYE